MYANAHKCLQMYTNVCKCIHKARCRYLNTLLKVNVFQGCIMTSVSIRLSKKEEFYLSELMAKYQQLSPYDDNVSLGKIIKKLLEYCANNNVDFTKSDTKVDDDLRKMIEQIHVAIPNLMYLSRVSSTMAIKECKADEFSPYKQSALNYMSEVCGDFQNVSYRTLRVKMDDNGIKKAPIDKEKSLWK